MGSPTFHFVTPNMKPEEAVKIAIRAVKREVLAPRPRYIATLDDKDVEIKRESSWSEDYLIDGKSVKDRKPEFIWYKIDPTTSKRTPKSLARSTTINIVQEVPFNKLLKNVIPESEFG